MPRVPTALVALAALALPACSSLDFDVGQDLPEQRVPGSPLGGLLPSFLPNPIPITVDIRQETQRRSTGPASHAYLKSISLTATPHANPSGTFDFLSELHVFVAPTGTSSLPRVEVARSSPVPRGVTTLPLNVVSGVDLLPYVNAGATITAEAKGTQPATDFTYDGHIEISVKL